MTGGCDRLANRQAENGLPKPLPHRYEECVLLDQAEVNCWHWRPLPDSLSLEGYDGFRYIARLKGMPMRQGGPGYLVYRAECELVGQEWNMSADELRSGGGIRDCDSRYRVLRISYGQKQTICSLIFRKASPDSGKTEQENRAAEIQWFFVTGEPPQAKP